MRDFRGSRSLLPQMGLLDLHAGRFDDAAAHLREGLQIAVRTGGWIELDNGLDGCGHLCAATGRPAKAVTMWAAHAALLARGARASATQEQMRPQTRAAGKSPCAPPARRSGLTGPGPQRSAARR